MFGSKRSLFSAERGSTTSWLAGITSVALLIGTVALPAVATEGDPAAPPVVVEEVQDPAVEVLPETTPVEDPAPEEVVAEEVTPVEEPAPEVVAADPAPSVDEPEVVEEPAVEAPATEAVIDQPLETVAEEPAPIVGERTDALTAEDVKSAEPAASSTDGDTPDNNSPPIDDAPFTRRAVPDASRPPPSRPRLPIPTCQTSAGSRSRSSSTAQAPSEMTQAWSTFAWRRMPSSTEWSIPGRRSPSPSSTPWAMR